MPKNHEQRIGLDDVLSKDKLEVSSHIFYRKEYRELSNDAKIVYQYILKRFSVSEINYAKAIEEDTLEDFTFVDEDNNVFCYVSNDELRFIANISEKTVIKVKDELDKAGLLHEDKGTAHKNNRLYLNKIIMDLQDKKEFKKELDMFKEEQKQKRLEKNKKRKKSTKSSSTNSKVADTKKEQKDKPKKPDTPTIHTDSESEPQKLQFNEPQILQFMNRKNYRQSTLESFSTYKYFSTLEILNLNHNKYENTDLNILWDLKIPKDLKVKIKVLLANGKLELSNEQLFEIEEAYHYQIQKQYVIPECESSNLHALNDYQFTSTVLKMLSTVKSIDSIKALIDSWVKRAIDYKYNELRELNYENLVTENLAENNTLSAFKEVFKDL
jgi:Replication initiator protein A (RepA) N-terminus